MWICNKCETYNEDHEQYCCICNAKKNEASVTLQTGQQHPQGQKPRGTEILPSERISATVVKPPKPKAPPPPSMMRGSKDDLMDSFGMGGREKGITTALIAVNAALLLINVIGRIILL